MAAKKPPAAERPKVLVDDVEYEIPAKLTFRETSLIKKLTGLRLGEFDEALAVNDPDLLVGFAAVSVMRQHPTFDPDTLYEKEVGTIRFVFPDVRAGEGDERPPDEVAAEAAEAGETT